MLPNKIQIIVFLLSPCRLFSKVYPVTSAIVYVFIDIKPMNYYVTCYDINNEPVYYAIDTTVQSTHPGNIWIFIHVVNKTSSKNEHNAITLHVVNQIRSINTECVMWPIMWYVMNI